MTRIGSGTLTERREMAKKIRDPAMPLYVADWFGSQSIMLMTLEEEGAYLRLLLHAWASGDCTLPDDDQALSVLSRLGQKWFDGSGEKIRRCFNVRGNAPTRKLFNSKQLFLWKERRAHSEKCRLAGLKSGDARRSGTNERSTNVGTKPPTKHPTKTNSSSSSSSSFTSSFTEEKESLRSPAFDRFWECYPKRNGKIVGKASSRSLYAKLSKDDQEHCILAAAHYARSTTATEGFAKDPERFLKKDFWRDWLEPQVVDTPSRVAGPEDWKNWNPTDAGLGARA